MLNITNKKNTKLTVLDPWANPDEVMKEYGINSVKKLPDDKKYDAIVLAVAHDQFKDLDINSLKKENSIVYDVKNLFSKDKKDKNL